MNTGIKNLTQDPIRSQLFNLAMPIMATSFIQMAYSLTDMAWVGRIGSEAAAAVGAVGILIWMSSSIALLNKVGSEVSVGQSIGAQNFDDARKFASHNISIALIISVIWGTILFGGAHLIIQIYELEARMNELASQMLENNSDSVMREYDKAAADFERLHGYSADFERNRVANGLEISGSVLSSMIFHGSEPLAR